MILNRRLPAARMGNKRQSEGRGDTNQRSKYKHKHSIDDNITKGVAFRVTSACGVSNFIDLQFQS